jgi:uncharacterized protein YodC (DUF2158 family)
MANKFHVGDIVQLKSGGPAMTIEKETEGNSSGYWCEWFRGASKERAHFTEDTLKIYVAPNNDD